MKRIPYLLSLLLIFGQPVIAQTKTAKATSAAKKETGTTVITDLIIYDFVLYDTAKTENVAKEWAGMTINDYNNSNSLRYLSVAQSIILRNELTKLIKRKDLIYFNGYDPMTHEKAMERTTVLLTVNEEDSLGNAIGTRTIADTIAMEKWNRVTFYEEWKLNKANGMLEKNVMGYVFQWYDDNKGLWIQLFGIARDKATLEKIKKLQGW